MISQPILPAMLVCLFLANYAAGDLERSAASIKEYKLGEDRVSMVETDVPYSGGLRDRFGVLRESTYWSKDCLESFENPQDVVFSTVVPATLPSDAIES